MIYCTETYSFQHGLSVLLLVFWSTHLCWNLVTIIIYSSLLTQKILLYASATQTLLVPHITQACTIHCLSWRCLRTLSWVKGFPSRMCLKTQMCWFCWGVWLGDGPNQKETMHSHSGKGFQLDQRNMQCVRERFHRSAPHYLWPTEVVTCSNQSQDCWTWAMN